MKINIICVQHGQQALEDALIRWGSLQITEEVLLHQFMHDLHIINLNRLLSVLIFLEYSFVSAPFQTDLYLVYISHDLLVYIYEIFK